MFALLRTPAALCVLPSFYTSHILHPCLSTAGFVCAVVPGTEGPPPSSPDVSLLAHPGRGQPAVEGEMQRRRWVTSLCWTRADRQCAVWTLCLNIVVVPVFKINVYILGWKKKKSLLVISFCLSSNRHRRASAPQEEENCQAWLHSQPLEECLHQAAQNRH